MKAKLPSASAVKDRVIRGAAFGNAGGAKILRLKIDFADKMIDAPSKEDPMLQMIYAKLTPRHEPDRIEYESGEWQAGVRAQPRRQLFRR
jgi:hypothetical protein